MAKPRHSLCDLVANFTKSKELHKTKDGVASLISFRPVLKEYNNFRESSRCRRWNMVHKLPVLVAGSLLPLGARSSPMRSLAHSSASLLEDPCDPHGGDVSVLPGGEVEQ